MSESGFSISSHNSLLLAVGILNGLAPEEEMEIDGSEEFSVFPEDVVAEQLTYMDAVSTEDASDPGSKESNYDDWELKHLPCEESWRTWDFST